MAYEQLQLQNQLCFRLYTASRLITQAYEPYLMPLGLTYTQYLVLLVLWETDVLPVNDIGKRLMLGINTVSPLIRRMESSGLLSRRDSTTDKRQQIVFLTEKGKQMREISDMDDCGVESNELTSVIPPLDNMIEALNKRVIINLKKRKSK